MCARSERERGSERDCDHQSVRAGERVRASASASARSSYAGRSKTQNKFSTANSILGMLMRPFQQTVSEMHIDPTKVLLVAKEGHWGRTFTSRRRARARRVARSRATTRASSIS
jgi:hypothetical protein